ncbi:MAG: acyl-CoA dehydrogenase [Tepidanaerobacteraceae bacterium]|nr:acyl-CoA dehydrogenase [Thermoanaerobacterales bacterium]
MNFSLTPEQEMIRNVVREFAEKEVAPIAAEIDETGRVPIENIEKMAELGLMGMPYPKKYGGAETDYISYIIAYEEIAKACASTAVILGGNVSLTCFPIYQFGTEEQRQKFLVPLAKGEKLGAFALTEPNAGSDASNQETIAVLDGDEYVLNGNKIFITGGGLADIYLVFAMTDKTKGLRGISSFIVEKGTPGFTFGKKENKMGMRGSCTTELILQDVRIPKENLLGREGEGFKIAMSTLDVGRVGVGALCVGIAQAALDESIKYAKERIQFGRPIGKFQAIQFMLADMATEVETARLLVHKAAWLKDNKLPFSKESAMAKLYASETAMRCTLKAVQIHGGYGYMKEYKVERLMRDAKITEIFEGTSEIQRMVIGKSLLKD